MSAIRVRDPFRFEFPDFPSLFRTLMSEGEDKLAPFVEEGSLAVDISEGKEGELYVRASVPGFRKEDVQVNVHQGVLDIRAERKEETETKDQKFYRRERRWGSFSRRIALPGNPSEEGVTAELKDGVLTVKIPPAKGSTPRRVEIR